MGADLARLLVFGIGLLLTVLGVSLLGAQQPAGLYPLFIGLIFMVAAVIERVRYRSNEAETTSEAPAARPLTGEGVKHGIEQVKLVPSASGAPGTFLRFGRYIRQGWLGSDYLIARRVLADGSGHVFHAAPSDNISRAVGLPL